MPNIMINRVCNLKCPYCFANEFVNTESCVHQDNITLENFQKALQFITGSEIKRVGIIGGEPTLHPEFRKIMDCAITNPQIDEITLFTNGILLDRYPEIFTSPKVHVLINVNPPSDIGEARFAKLVKNLDTLFKNTYVSTRFSLGINMYKPDFDYEYILELLQRYHLKHVRTSIVVPNSNENKSLDIRDYFFKMKPRVFEFFKHLSALQIMPTYDCNMMPVCITTPEEKHWLEEFWKFEDNVGFRCNVTDHPHCDPIIDILPNLEMVRCFGMSTTQKASLQDFKNIHQVAGFFTQEIDHYASLLYATSWCKTCFHQKTGECMGGCMAFKSQSITKLKDLVKETFLQEGKQDAESAI